MHPLSERWNQDSELYPQVAELIEGSPVVLDVGCGDGTLAEFLVGKGHQVLGIDHDPQVLPQDGAGTHFELADASSMPFGNDSFDAVVCVSALHHQADPTLPVVEMARVVKPGGKVVVVGRAADKTAADVARRAKDAARWAWVSRGKTPWKPDTQEIEPSMGWDEWRELLGELLPGSSFERVGSGRYLAVWRKEG